MAALILALLAAVQPSTSSAATPKTVVAWGRNTWGESVVPPGLSDVRAISSAAHSMVLRNDGTVIAWGDNEAGETDVPAGLANVIAIAAGGFHSLALRSDGTVVAWGDNTYGQSTVPAGLKNVIAISGGRYHSLALRSDGTVVAWGRDDHGQATVPAGLKNVVAIDAGGYHSLALRSDGTVVAWGDNSHGQATVPAGLSGVTAIAAGWYHSLALRSDGRVVAWGDNSYGQSAVPANLPAVAAISAGATHSLVALDDGTVATWGDNAYHQQNVPAGLTGVMAVTGKAMNSMVIADDPPPTPVTGLTAPIATATKIVLNWKYPAQPTDRDIARIVVRRAAGTVAPSSPQAGVGVPLGHPLTTSATDPVTTHPGDQYSYAVFAIDLAGNVGQRATITVPAAFPGPVTGATAKANDPFSATLSWHNPGGVSLTKIIVRRATGGTPPATATDGTGVAVSPALAETAVSTGLTPGRQYSYSIFARDGIGNLSSLGAGSTTTVTTPPDTTPPPAVTNLHITSSTSSSVTLGWTNTVPAQNDLSKIIVRRWAGDPASISPTGGTNIAVSPARGETVTDSGVVSGHDYTYAVYERDIAGNYSRPAAVHATVP